MRKNHIIPHKNATDVLIDICCDPFSSKCLLRICKHCETKYITSYQEFDNSVVFSYWLWASKREHIVQNGREKNLRYDAAAVWAHVLPILEYLEQKAPQITTLHFVSDSATSQYRNYKTFFVIGAWKCLYPRLVSLTWNYTESGHGKGAPDGVGGTLKRIADAIVSRGHDIPDFDTFVEELKFNTKNIVIETVSDYDIIEKDILFPTDLRSFKGTQQVHQAIWNDSDKYQVTMRNLSCVEKACIIQPRCCSHVKYLGSYALRSEILSNPSNIDPAHKIQNPNPSNMTCSVVPLQRSFAFCSTSEANLPEELIPEIATIASDVRSECTDLSLPEELIIQNLTSVDSFNLPEAGVDISDVEALDISLQTVSRSVLDERFTQQSSSGLTELATFAKSPVTTESDHDVPLFQPLSSNVRRPGNDFPVPATNSFTCSKTSRLSIARPLTAKYVSPDITRSHSKVGPSKSNSKGRKKEKILTHTPKINKKLKELRNAVEKKRQSATIINKKYSQDTIRNKLKTKIQRKNREETNSDEEMTLPPSPQSDLYNVKDEAIEESESEENDDSFDVDEDNVHEGDWVVVKFDSQKNLIHRYVGQVVNESLASLDVKFAKKINDRRFKWPEKIDISVVGKYQVIKKLPAPYFKSSSKRIGAFEFPKSLRKLKIDK
ncbi:unnamed protein product [Euphydryas editha]|uniref:Transposase domain-containing protein n=1 Tax=Euphydryas editha TaxID=104508 RepID=A0AAU9VD67_EUPED|nr:unnamed protein product [Euphydryas editha]